MTMAGQASVAQRVAQAGPGAQGRLQPGRVLVPDNARRSPADAEPDIRVADGF